MGIYTNIQVKSFGFGGDSITPPVSDNGSIVFSQEETIIEHYSVKNVKIMGKSSGNWICDFGMEPMPANDSWTITITNRRITFITPYTPSFFGGKVVLKNGKVSVGQVMINDVDSVKIDLTKEPYILTIYYRRSDGAGLYFFIEAEKNVLDSIDNAIKAIKSNKQ